MYKNYILHAVPLPVLFKSTFKADDQESIWEEGLWLENKNHSHINLK
jgi:hypothetical protein